MTKIDKLEAIQQALSGKFEIRFNSITAKSEYRHLGSDTWEDVNISMMKEFRKEMNDNGIKISLSEIRTALEKKNFERKIDQSNYEEIELYLSTIIETRFNVIKQKPEYRYFEGDWLPVTKYLVNSLNRQVSAMGIKCSVNKINEIFFSDFSPETNPVKDYLTDFEEFNIARHGDQIRKLADTVKVVNEKNWYEYLKRWLVAVVANAMIDERCANHTMLMLTGSQGKFKTTWLDNLCPKKLNQYLFSGKINLENKDTLTLIAENFLINIDDQMKQLNKKDENEIKNLITVNSVKYRRPYDVFIQDYPHLASFMGSVNGNEFLTDPTGSRRFLPFEVLNIDIDKAKQIDIDLVWNQAYSLFKSGMRYWFNDAEIQELNENNNMFAVVSIEEQMLLQYFEKPKYRGLATHDMQPAEILSYLQDRTRTTIRMKSLGEALQKHGYEKWRKTVNSNQMMVYSVIKKDLTDVQNQMQANNEILEKQPF